MHNLIGSILPVKKFLIHSESSEILLTFEGNWKDDEKCGTGSEFYKDESSYKGEWENNLKNGEGTFVYAVSLFETVNVCP